MLTSSEPAFGTRDPLGGETTVAAVTGGSGAIFGQVTVEVSCR